MITFFFNFFAKFKISIVDLGLEKSIITSVFLNASKLLFWILILLIFFPILRENDFGDLYLETNVIIPESLSKEQKDLLIKFKSLEDSNNNSEVKNFINKAKKFWSGG